MSQIMDIVAVENNNARDSLANSQRPADEDFGYHFDAAQQEITDVEPGDISSEPVDEPSDQARNDPKNGTKNAPVDSEKQASQSFQPEIVLPQQLLVINETVSRMLVGQITSDVVQETSQQDGISGHKSLNQQNIQQNTQILVQPNTEADAPKNNAQAETVINQLSVALQDNEQIKSVDENLPQQNPDNKQSDSKTEDTYTRLPDSTRLNGNEDIVSTEQSENLSSVSDMARKSIKSKIDSDNANFSAQQVQSASQTTQIQTNLSFQQGVSQDDKPQIEVSHLPNADSSSGKTETVQSLFNAGKTDAANDIDMQQNVDRIVKAARTTIGRGGSMIQLCLEPPELGILRIEIRYSNSGVDLQLQATNTRAQQLLQQTNESLRAALEAVGIQTNQIDVQLRLDLRNDNPANQQQFADDSNNTDQQPSQQSQYSQQQSSSQDGGAFDQPEFMDNLPNISDDNSELVTAGLPKSTQWRQLDFNNVDLMI